MRRIKSCRVCYNHELVPVGNLGNISVSDFTKTPSKGTQYPLNLVYCKRCTLVQLSRDFPRKKLYKDYWYQSHFNKEIVKNLEKIGKLCWGRHMDIGSNDGTLLKASKGIFKIGIDPSNIQPTGFVWINDYFENVHLPEKADTITAIACLYDLPDPNKFMQNIKYHLADEGIFIAQLMTLAPMIENNDISNICHEHLEYYSYKSLVWLYEQNGLEIYKVEKNKINGGSYLIFARHFTKGSIPFIEKEYGEYELMRFIERIEMNKTLMKIFLGTHKGVYGYGASTKANTILQYYGIHSLRGIVDINPEKTGRFMINSTIPIISKIPKDCRYLWVFPYGFLKYFKRKEKAYTGEWITTIPDFEIC